MSDTKCTRKIKWVDYAVWSAQYHRNYKIGETLPLGRSFCEDHGINNDSQLYNEKDFHRAFNRIAQKYLVD